MAFRFKSATAVAVGTFNIYVIQPKWLVEAKLYPEGAKFRVETDLNRPGFRYSAEGFPMRWDLRPDRLVIHSDEPTEDCGKTLADVLEKLPWTPLTGVGTNFEFHGELSNLAGVSRACALPSCTTPVGYSTMQRTAHLALERGSQVFNLQLAEIKEAELSINVHTELKDKGTQEQVNRLAQDACRQFLAFRADAESLVKEVFNLELIYE